MTGQGAGAGVPGLQTPANHVPSRPGPAQGSGNVLSQRDCNFGLGFPRLVIHFLHLRQLTRLEVA